LLISLILPVFLSSCSNDGIPVSIFTRFYMEKSLLAKFDVISEAIIKFPNKDDFDTHIKDEYGMTATAICRTLDSDGRLHKTNIEGVSGYEVLKLVYDNLKANIGKLEGYKLNHATIPTPIDGQLNGYWLEGSVDVQSVHDIYGFSGFESGVFFAFFNPSRQLYEVAFYFYFDSKWVEGLEIKVFFN
jgi:hypothetical protein